MFKSQHIAACTAVLLCAGIACSTKQKATSEAAAETNTNPTTSTPTSTSTSGDATPNPCTTKTTATATTATDTSTTDTSTDESALALTTTTSTSTSGTGTSTGTKSKTSTSTAGCDTTVPDTTTTGDVTSEEKLKADCAAKGLPIFFQKKPLPPICHDGVKLVAKGSDWCVDAASIKAKFQTAPYFAGAAIEKAYNGYIAAGAVTVDTSGFTLDQCGIFADGHPIIYLMKSYDDGSGVVGPLQKQLQAKAP